MSRADSRRGRDDGAVLQPREHCDTGTGAGDLRRADEDGVKGTARHPLDVEVRFKGVDLPTERVALDRDVHQLRERMRMTGNILREKDRARACPPYGHPGRRAVAQLRDDPVVLRELADRRALAAGDDERVDVVELLRPPHVDTVGADLAQPIEVLAEIALEAEDADASGLGRCYQPRTARRSPAGMVSSVMPRIGSPRPRETSAMSFASLKWVVASTIAFAKRAGSPDL